MKMMRFVSVVWFVLIVVSCTTSQPSTGKCSLSSDCGASSICLPNSQCAPKCTTAADCQSDQICSSVGACVARGKCGIDADCIDGKVCSRQSSVCEARCTTSSCSSGLECQSDGHCAVPGSTAPATSQPTSCGGQLLSSPRIPPNVHVVLDGSESMMDCIATGGDGVPLPGLCDSNPDSWLYTLNGATSKWASAKEAIKQMTTTYADEIRFGLSVFPSWTYGMPPNTSDANALYSWWVQEWNSKGGQLDCTGGSVKVPLAANPASAFVGLLPDWAPGAGTPIAAALSAMNSLPSLVDPARSNYVLLITDGMENCGGNPVGEVQNLRAKGIKTAVVGFGSLVDPEMLKLMAIAGGAESPLPMKYYQADNSASLISDLKTIARGLRSCDFKIEQAPADVSKMYVYVNGSLASRDTTGTNGWNYDAAQTRLTLYGSLCADYKSVDDGKVSVVYGCPDDSLVEGFVGSNGGGGSGSGSGTGNGSGSGSGSTGSNGSNGADGGTGGGSGGGGVN